MTIMRTRHIRARAGARVKMQSPGSQRKLQTRGIITPFIVVRTNPSQGVHLGLLQHMRPFQMSKDRLKFNCGIANKCTYNLHGVQGIIIIIKNTIVQLLLCRVASSLLSLSVSEGISRPVTLYSIIALIINNNQ